MSRAVLAQIGQGFLPSHRKGSRWRISNGVMWKLPKTKKSGEHRWVVYEEAPKDVLVELSSYPPQIAHILSARGITTRADADVYFAKPSLLAMPDPYLMTDMDKAVKRLDEARTKKEHVVIFADNDPDGNCGGVVIHELLTALHIDHSIYLPDPLREGHSMTNEAVEEIVQRSAALVITVDLGVREHQAIAALREYGIDTLVTDHHLFPPEEPAAVAIINPRREGDPYNFSGLCGAGVAFVFAQAVVASPMGAALSDDFLPSLLDVVAIATIADMMPLQGPSRILLQLGIEALRKTTRPGLVALYAIAKIDQAETDEHTIAFELAPRVGAAAKVSEESVAYELLSTRDAEEAHKHAQTANRLNGRKQREIKKIVDRARQILAKSAPTPAIVIRDDSFSPTLVGISANRIREKTKKPVFLCSKTAKGIRCSGRSNKGFNILDALDACGGEDLLEDYGGHPQAAGFTIREDWFDLFIERINTYTEKNMQQGADAVPLMIDLQIRPHEISPELVGWIRRLEPFGMENRRPRFLVTGLEVLERKAAGLRGSGVRMKLVPKEGGRAMKAVSRNADALPALRPGDMIDIVCELRVETFKGRSDIVIVVIDAKIHVR